MSNSPTRLGRRIEIASCRLECILRALSLISPRFRSQCRWGIPFYRFYIQEFSQRGAGLQTLGAQLFTASDLPLARADFGDNQIRRLTERLFDGVEDTLEVIGLGNNLLGDNLNPVFSSGEFQNLKRLRALDLSYNKLTEIEDGLLEGCVNLKVRRTDELAIDLPCSYSTYLQSYSRPRPTRPRWKVSVRWLSSLCKTPCSFSCS